MANVIKYCPPKSQIWGHRLGRLTAVQIVERGLRFLNEQSSTAEAKPAEFIVDWSAHSDRSVSETIHAINGQLGAAAKVGDYRDGTGLMFHHLRWLVSAAQLPAVASWFDELREALHQGEVVAHCSMTWMFKLKDEAGEDESVERYGGMFGIHLGRVQGITTMFGFRDVAHYGTIKDYLRSIELVELSDKHVRPKGSVPMTARRAR